MGSTCELTCQSEFYVSRVRVFMSSCWGLLRMLHLTRNTNSHLTCMLLHVLQVAGSPDDSEIDSNSAFHEINAAVQTLPRVRALLAKLHRASPESKKICPRG